MKALVYHGPHQLNWQEWPDRDPGPGEAVLAVHAVGICGSDIHGYTGESGRRVPPMVMGHEASGEIVAVGPGVSTDKIGPPPVVLQPLLFCGKCDQCRAGFMHRCRSRKYLGANVSGAMAERLVVPLSNLLPRPEGVSAVHSTLVEPLAVAIHAVAQAGEVAGQSVLIAGCGPIGLLTNIAAREVGADRIVMTDILANRRAVAETLGATVALDPTAENWQEALAEAIGAKEVDVAFDAVGIASTFNQTLNTVKPGGVAVALGGWLTVPVPLPRLVSKEIQVKGTFTFTVAEFDQARRWLAEERFDPTALVTDVRPLSEGAAVFEELTGHRSESIKVVLTNET